MACIVPLYPSSEALPREYLTPYHRSLIAPDRYLGRKNSPLTGADYNGQGRLGVQPTGLVLDVPAPPTVPSTTSTPAESLEADGRPRCHTKLGQGVKREPLVVRELPGGARCHRNCHRTG